MRHTLIRKGGWQSVRRGRAFAKSLFLLSLTSVALFLGCLPWLGRLLAYEWGPGYLPLLLMLAGLVLLAGLSCLFGMQIYCRWILKARLLRQPLSGLEQWLHITTFRLALRRQISPPRVAIYPSRELNAFALGWHRQHATIVLSEGLVQGLKPGELESVLAHEISHITNGDVQFLALLQGVLTIFINLPARFLDYIVSRCWTRYAAGGAFYVWTVVLLQLAGGWLASLLIMHISRSCEYQADRGAAQLVGIEQMHAALRCLDVMTAGAQSRQLAAFGLPARLKFRFIQLFNSHPSLHERLRALHTGI